MRNRRLPPTSPGSALVAVLASLGLVMVLLLAFMQGTSNQNTTAQSDALAVQEQFLTDSAVALVIGQVQQASSQAGQAWISQPGLLRTYAATAARKPTACYKLYSAAAMTDRSGSLAFLTNDVPTDWNSEVNRNAYTDLNAPVRSSYPILNPAALTGVQGVTAETGHGVEMPVAWLYQLQDGTLGPASGGTEANPIVGRIAFWTDDETGKINVNTAGTGSGWNAPHANSVDDVAWSTNAPAQGEVTSYPGHPATTSLAPAFGTNAVFSPKQLLALTPRYGWGGSQLATVATAAGQVLPPKRDRLYSSIDELAFASDRSTNVVTPAQIEAARFVLTAQSQAPETTLNGEPRISIWPVSDQPDDSTRTTATDRALAAVATVGTRKYYFQRHSAGSATDDLDPLVSPSNAQLFSDLVARGNLALPGCDPAKTFTAKFPGATWTQLLLEITDAIRSTNAIDPSPAPFVPFAAGEASGLGRGFVVPLTTDYVSGASTVKLRGLGRCPTLASLTIVFYVSGFDFNDGTYVDYTETPDDADGTNWKANFVTTTTKRWDKVIAQRVRCFVVPTTFHPGCGYPEVSDPCRIQIEGLDRLSVISGTKSGDFGFASVITSDSLGTPLQKLAAARAWGGNSGPILWRATGDALANGGTATYPFASSKAFPLPMSTTSATLLDPKTNTSLTNPWPPTGQLELPALTGANGLTVRLLASDGTTVLQTLALDLPYFKIHAPTIKGEGDHADGSTPGTASATWAADTTRVVPPSWYMSLRNRLLATQGNRAAMIQAGDISGSIEAAGDLRVVAGLASVPATQFKAHPSYGVNVFNAQGGTHAHNLRFADGVSACFASGTTRLMSSAAYPTGSATLLSVKDWSDTTKTATYTYLAGPPCTVAAGTSGVSGDWDTGPGFAPDGALIHLPDAGTSLAGATAYQSLDGGLPGATTQRTPNGLVPSPVIFGSLPAGIDPVAPASSLPWRTLLFCPNPVTSSAHPGFASPPDHLLLDQFWMPVAEPLAPGGVMSTAGKINLNNQIAPFTWLHRRTSFHALLRSLRIPAISTSLASKYKTAGTPTVSIWKTVDEEATIAQIEDRFSGASTDAYLSESEICTVPLVPQGQASDTVANTRTKLEKYWNDSTGLGRLTGDNLRELPYAQLYSRLTTRSNSYTVHLRVQILRKQPGAAQQDVWNEGVDLVRGEWRGSCQIERYLDPATAAPVAGQPLGPYKFRVVGTRRFAP